jgi:hypothetical protein
MRRRLGRQDTHRERDRSDDVPVRSGRHADPKVYGARSMNIRPLERWLSGQIGRQWNEVWSEACGIADIRSHRGWKLRHHLEFLVETIPLRITSQQFQGFFVDPETGCLQHQQPAQMA